MRVASFKRRLSLPNRKVYFDSRVCQVDASSPAGFLASVMEPAFRLDQNGGYFPICYHSLPFSPRGVNAASVALNLLFVWENIATIHGLAFDVRRCPNSMMTLRSCHGAHSSHLRTNKSRLRKQTSSSRPSYGH